MEINQSIDTYFFSPDYRPGTRLEPWEAEMNDAVSALQGMGGRWQAPGEFNSSGKFSSRMDDGTEVSFKICINLS